MRTITFFSTMPGVADVFPVVEAKTYRPNWIAQARNSYLKTQEESNGNKFSHIYRCPGIFDIMSTGYLVTLPWDVTIETNGDGEGFRWTLPTADLPKLAGTPLVGIHTAANILECLPPRPGCLQSIIKFNTPWHVVAPPGVRFIAMPVPYTDSFEFEHNHGILDPGYSTEINPQVWWKVLNGKHTIKAGTPMMQLIPLTEEKFKLKVQDATEKEIAWAKKKEYLRNMSFVFNRTFIKNMYLKHFYK